MRSPPLERPFKGRIYGLILFPKVFETLQKLDYVKSIDINNWTFATLKPSLQAPIQFKQNKDLLSSQNSGIDISSLVTTSTQSEVQSQTTTQCKLWEGPLDEIRELADKVQSKYKGGVYPYLFELSNISSDEGTKKLCSIISNIMKKVTPEPKRPISIKKPTLKQKEYNILYDPKLHAKVKRQAMRGITYQDLEDRKEYIAEKIRIGNEEIEKEMKLILKSKDECIKKKVRVSDIPTECVRLISPVSIMRDGVFSRESQFPL